MPPIHSNTALRGPLVDTMAYKEIKRKGEKSREHDAFFYFSSPLLFLSFSCRLQFAAMKTLPEAVTFINCGADRCRPEQIHCKLSHATVREFLILSNAETTNVPPHPEQLRFHHLAAQDQVLVWLCSTTPENPALRLMRGCCSDGGPRVLSFQRSGDRQKMRGLVAQMKKGTASPDPPVCTCGSSKTKKQKCGSSCPCIFMFNECGEKCACNCVRSTTEQGDSASDEGSDGGWESGMEEEEEEGSDAASIEASEPAGDNRGGTDGPSGKAPRNGNADGDDDGDAGMERPNKQRRLSRKNL